MRRNRRSVLWRRSLCDVTNAENTSVSLCFCVLVPADDSDKGKKFNARKETAEGEEYYGIKVFRFYIVRLTPSTRFETCANDRNARLAVRRSPSRRTRRTRIMSVNRERRGISRIGLTLSTRRAEPTLSPTRRRTMITIRTETRGKRRRSGMLWKTWSGLRNRVEGRWK